MCIRDRFLESLEAIALEEANLVLTKRVGGEQEEQIEELTHADEAQWLNVNTPGDWPDDK